MKKQRTKKATYDEKAHEERVRVAGALALNFLKGPARQRVVLAWLQCHWDLVVTEELERIEQTKKKRQRRAA